MHKGEAIGPRPELRKEMKTKANVDFYMYHTEQFMKFSQEQLNITIPAMVLQELSEKSKSERLPVQHGFQIKNPICTHLHLKLVTRCFP